MQVTLLRSFRKTVITSGEPDGLERGRLVYRFALMPFAGRLPRAEALRELAKLQTGVCSRQTGKRPSGFPPMEGREPSTQSFMELQTGSLIVSAIKPAEQGKGLVIRLWNPTAQARTETLRFWRTVANAELLHLNEECDPKSPRPKRSGKTVSVRAAPHRIVTLHLTFD